MTNHRWSFCNTCDQMVVICGTCGNNCCNGGHGEVIGLEPGTTMPCPACDSAYEMQSNGLSEAVRETLEFDEYITK
jgi:hypothetical protein